MGTTWVLDTETKGTGANMVPLERVTKRSSTPPRRYVMPERRRREAAVPKPKAPATFRVIDVMTRRTILDCGNARETIESLASVRSVVDVNVYLWDEEKYHWLLLPFEEQSALMKLAPSSPPVRETGGHRDRAPLMGRAAA